jgi:DNA-binding GntR family transcriptional regulator
MSITTVADQSYEILKGKILARELLPGVKLQETDLAAELGVSRTPLREAVTRLANEGLITVEARRGAYVARLKKAEVEEILEVREALECQAVRTAARKARKEDLDFLEQVLTRRHQQLVHAPEADDFEDFDFHEAVVRLSGNSRLIAMMEQIHNQLTVLRRGSSFIMGRSAEALAEHRAIVEAIASGDPDAAEHCVRTHISNSRENILKNVIVH